jgi:hypothetical protein
MGEVRTSVSDLPLLMTKHSDTAASGPSVRPFGITGEHEAREDPGFSRLH